MIDWIGSHVVPSMMAIVSWRILVVLVCAAFGAGLARGFSAFGSALIFMPVASAAIGPRQAVPIFLLTDLLMSLLLLPNALAHGQRREALVLFVGAVIALPIGAMALDLADPLLLRWIIVALAGSMLGVLLLGWRYRGSPQTVVTLAVGAMSGFGSGIAQIGGPPVVAYFLGGERAALVIRGTMNLFFFMSSILSFVVFAWRGMFTQDGATLAAILAPVYGFGIWLGARLFGLARETFFRRVSFALIVFAILISIPV